MQSAWQGGNGIWKGCQWVDIVSKREFSKHRERERGLVKHALNKNENKKPKCRSNWQKNSNVQEISWLLPQRVDGVQGPFGWKIGPFHKCGGRKNAYIYTYAVYVYTRMRVCPSPIQAPSSIRHLTFAVERPSWLHCLQAPDKSKPICLSVFTWVSVRAERAMLGLSAHLPGLLVHHSHTT